MSIRENPNMDDMKKALTSSFIPISIQIYRPKPKILHKNFLK